MATPADQLSKTLKTDTLGLPDVSKMKKSSDVLAAQQALIPRQAEAARKLKEAELGIETGIAGARAKAAEEYAGKEREALGQYEAGIKAAPLPEFKMTEDTAMTMGSLFSLTATLGIMLGASGKSSANRALAAMTGMLQGWKAGRQDLYQREKANYEKEFARVQAVHADLRKTFDDYVKLAATDKEAALLKGEELVRKAGANSILAAYVEKGQLDQADKLLNSAATQLRHKEDLANRLEASRAKAAAGGGRTSVLLAGRAENIREAFVQAAKDVENITKLPPGTVIGSFAGLAGKDGESLAEGLAATYTRKVTERESRFMQQLIAGIESNLSMALGGGYASSSSKARMDQYKAQVPKEGDDGYVAALFLARIKQELGVLAENFPSKPGATPEMNEAVQKAFGRVSESVPFDVQDVINASYAGTPPPEAGTKVFATEADAEAAFKDGTLKKGDRVTIGGVSGKWE